MNPLIRMAAVMLLTLSGWGVHAFPDRPVVLVFLFTASSGSDIIARTLAPKLSERWKQPVVVDNKPGASGNIGHDAVAKAAPDGYTILISNSSTFVSNPYLFKRMPFDPYNDFESMGLVASAGQVLIVHPSVPARTVAELTALAKASAGKLNFGSGGKGIQSHVSGEMYKSAVGIDIVHVPYKGVGLALPDMVSGKIQMVFYPPTFLQFVKEGKLRAIAISAPARSALLPEVPTTGESGMPDLLASSWHAIVAPAGVPAENIKKFHAALTTVMADKEVREKMASVGADPIGSTPEKFGPFMRTEVDKWRKVIKSSGITVD